MIKFIFQTWKTKNVPQEWENAQQSVINNNPDYEYKLYTDEDNRTIVETYFPDFLSYYDNFEYNIQRADAIRYMILYLYGGIYVDLDYVCNKSFNEIIMEKEIGLNKSINQSWSYTNSIMISTVKRHPIWLECVRQMKKRIPFFIRGKHLKVMTSTGPIMLTKSAKKFKKDIQILDIIQKCDVCTLKQNNSCDINKNYILTPIAGSSWIESDTKFYIWLFCNKKLIKRIMILVIIFVLLYIFVSRSIKIKIVSDKSSILFL
jgi:mannosyltransferase OCH1-like enzyme